MDGTELVPVDVMPAGRMLMPVVAIEEMARVHDMVAEVVDRVLSKDLDYGVIPGTTDKPVLLKPGAERLCTAFGLAAKYRIVESEVDHDHLNAYDMHTWVDANPPQGPDGRQDDDEINRLKSARLGRWNKRGENERGKAIWQWQQAVTEAGESQGLYRYVVECTLCQRSTAEIVGSGVGVCSTMESKYIRRPRDTENTVLKMAEKRALIAAVLNTLALSGRFTQDIEDMQGPEQRDHRANGRQAGHNSQGSPRRAPGRDRQAERSGDDENAVAHLDMLITELDAATNRAAINAAGAELEEALNAAIDDRKVAGRGETIDRVDAALARAKERLRVIAAEAAAAAEDSAPSDAEED